MKTDRRDAEKLARCYRAGELTAVWVPDAAHEALRDLVRAREGAKKDQLRHRHRLGKFLLRHGKRPVEAGPAWTRKYLNWIRIHAHFEQPALDATVEHYLHEVEHAAERIVKLEKAIDEAVAQAPAEIRTVIEALQALRGVAQATAATVVCELGSLARLPNRQCSSAPGPGGIGMDLSAAPQRAGPRVAKTEGAGAQRRGKTDRMESAAAVAQTFRGAGCPGQTQRSDRDGAGARVTGLHVGYRGAD